MKPPMQQTPLRSSCPGLPSLLWTPPLPETPLLSPWCQFPKGACQSRVKASWEQGPVESPGCREIWRARRGEAWAAGVMGILGEPEATARSTRTEKFTVLTTGMTVGGCQRVPALPHCVTNTKWLNLTKTQIPHVSKEAYSSAYTAL